MDNISTLDSFESGFRPAYRIKIVLNSSGELFSDGSILFLDTVSFGIVWDLASGVPQGLIVIDILQYLCNINHILNIQLPSHPVPYFFVKVSRNYWDILDQWLRIKLKPNTDTMEEMLLVKVEVQGTGLLT